MRVGSHAFTRLTAPSVARQHFMMQLAIVVSIESSPMGWARTCKREIDQSSTSGSVPSCRPFALMPESQHRSSPHRPAIHSNPTSGAATGVEMFAGQKTLLPVPNPSG